MRIGGGIDDDPIHLAVAFLDLGDEFSLFVGLHDRHADAALFTFGANRGEQVGIGLFAVDVRFPDAQKVEVRAVEYFDYHI